MTLGIRDPYVHELHVFVDPMHTTIYILYFTVTTYIIPTVTEITIEYKYYKGTVGHWS